MNDFTKEELILLLDCAWYYEDLREPKDQSRKFLIDKIQSMIDNYCEHPVLEPSVTGYKCLGCKRMFNE